jgi:hypothetical protein
MRPATVSSARAVRGALLTAWMFVNVLLMTGCYHFSPYVDWSTFSADDAVGSWCGEEGDVLTVTADSQFVWTGMSADIFERVTRNRDLNGVTHLQHGITAASGTWAVEDARRGVVSLALSINGLNESPFGSSDTLRAVRKGDVGMLLYYARDPDFGPDHEFTRCDEASGN